MVDGHKLSDTLQCCLDLIAKKNSKPEQHNQHDKHKWNQLGVVLSPEVSHVYHNHEDITSFFIQSEFESKFQT